MCPCAIALSAGSELATSGGAGVSAVAAAGGAGPPQPPPPLALKDVQCPICLKVFSRKFSLEMHFLIHQGLKPYKCQFCGRCFRQKGTLMRHKAIHSQTPSYRCGLCDKSYRQKNVFLHHLRNRHKVSTDVLDRRRCHIKNNAGGGVMEAVPAAPLPPPSLSSVCLPPLSPPEPPPGEAAPPVMLRISERQQALPPSSAVSSMWQCPFCAFESAHDPEVCRSHLLQHVGEPADCPLCPRQLASPQELAAHLRDFHESAGLAPMLTSPAVECTFRATRSSTKARSAAKHLHERGTPGPDRGATSRSTTSFCTAAHQIGGRDSPTFSRKGELLAHTRQRHLRRLPCPRCGRQFSYRCLQRAHTARCQGPPPLCLPVVDVQAARGALGASLLGVIPLVAPDGQEASPLLGVPVLAPDCLPLKSRLNGLHISARIGL
ncbi:hypothetical protein HPB50_025557 [Hyalomma asiaticum]|uniref:Uncharacterized protein n=1 Tax=Hyalomma asiaticum TaxID=266040 RepID=A0ACB7RP80_HYAAI|nr:hypothetical protein HPB50_025557 [Hyalomma asiaticum]